jgi:hypothetical protein
MQVEAGRIGRHVAYDSQQGFQVTNNRGFAANGNRYLTENQKQSAVDRGQQLSRYTAADAQDKFSAKQATHEYHKAYHQAWSDGNISKSEQRNLKDLKRDKKEAWAEVGKDRARREFGHTLEHAAKNGRITPNEREKLGAARENLEGMRSTVNSMRSRDARLDARDSSVRNSAQGYFEQFQSADLHRRGHGKVF